MKMMSVRWLLLFVIVFIQCDREEAKGAGSKSKPKTREKKKTANPREVRVNGQTDDHSQREIGGDNLDIDNTNTTYLNAQTILIELDERYLESYAEKIAEYCTLDRLRSRNISQDQFTVHGSNGDVSVILRNFRFGEVGFSHAGVSSNAQGVTVQVTYEGIFWYADVTISRSGDSSLKNKGTIWLYLPENTKMTYAVSLTRINDQTNAPWKNFERNQDEFVLGGDLEDPVSEEVEGELFQRMRNAIVAVIGDSSDEGGAVVDGVADKENEERHKIQIAYGLQLVIVKNDDNLIEGRANCCSQQYA